MAKSLAAAYVMVQQFAHKLSPGDSVIVNAANGVVGRVLAQMLALLELRVFAVVRKHTGVELLRRRLEELGCTKAFMDDDSLFRNVNSIRHWIFFRQRKHKH